MKICFVLPPVAKVTGGPLAILEYATRFRARGHDVSIATYPDIYWQGDRPFPWFDFPGEIRYRKLRGTVGKYWGGGAGKLAAATSLLLSSARGPRGVVTELSSILAAGALNPAILSRVLVKVMGEAGERLSESGGVEFTTQLLQSLSVVGDIPDCDLCIATWWMTAFPVYLSGKGVPVFFIQHDESLFYPNDLQHALFRAAVHMSYRLPLKKVANSSWLKARLKELTGEDVPFSNNGLDLSAFSPGPKDSEKDGVIRVLTYCGAPEWKGMADACAAMARVFANSKQKIEWHVFGFRDPKHPPDNSAAPYRFHEGLSFAELARLYSRSDIVLCPSWYESFPLPPLEAMASGTAVVTTRPGTEDYAFDSENALVVRARDVDAMAEAVLRFAADPSIRERCGALGRATALGLTWNAAIEKRERLLHGIAEGRFRG